MRRYLFLLLFTVFFFRLGQAQKAEKEIKWVTDEKGGEVLGDEIISKDAPTNKDKIRITLNALREEGYLEASVDKQETIKDTLYVYLHIGKAYKWAELEVEKENQNLLSKAGVKLDFLNKKQITPSGINQIFDKILSYYSQNGFPFAEVSLTNFRFDNEILKAKLVINKHEVFRFGEIQVEGEANISEQYLSNYLGIKKGALYDERKINLIRVRIKELVFLKEKRPPSLVFVENEVIVRLFLNKNRSSKIDGILGLLPNSNAVSPDEPARFVITGTAEIELINPFGTGKEMGFEFEQLRPGTQDMKVYFSYPYIAGFQFGADLDLDLYKADSSYLDVVRNVGLEYYFEGGNKMKVFWNRTSSTILTVDDGEIIQTKELPSILDVQYDGFGLAYAFQRLDYRLNPRKGFSISAKGSAGYKTVERNTEIVTLVDPLNPNFDFASLYEGVDERSFQFRLEGEVAYFIPFLKRNTVKVGVRSGWVFGENQLLQNEMFLIGGNKLLRGFNEREFFSPFFAVSTLEYRFLIATNSYLYAFSDISIMDISINDVIQRESPIGFGAGMTFDTSAGLFSISYALGKRSENPLDLRSAKIHFGYINFF